MNKKLFILFSIIIFILIGYIKTQDSGIFEGGDEADDEEFVGSNVIDTPQAKAEESSEEKDKKEDSKPATAPSSTTTSTSTSANEDKSAGMDDEDEFDGIETKSEKKDEKKISEEKKATPEPRNFKPMTWLDFIPEAATLAFIIIYVAYYYLHYKINEKKILSWMEKNKDILLDNFTNVKHIIKMNNSEFRVKCTGRLNCVGMEMNFVYKKEHDLIYSLINKFYPTEEELVNIEIPVGKDAMPTFALILMKKSKIAQFKKDNSFIAAVTTEVQNEKYPEGTSILTDTKDLIPLVLSKETRKTYKKLEKYVEFVYVNDQHAEQPEFPNFIRFTFKLPPTNEEFRELFLTVFDVLDRAVTLEMPKPLLQKVSKKRVELQKMRSKAEHEKREERAQQLKDEKKKKLMENKDEMSEKELAKLEQKEKKKNMKKSTGKMKRVVVG